MDLPAQIDHHLQQAKEHRFNEQGSRLLRNIGWLGIGLGLGGFFYAGMVSEAPTPGRVFEGTISLMITAGAVWKANTGRADTAESSVLAASNEIAAGILMAQQPQIPEK